MRFPLANIYISEQAISQRALAAKLIGEARNVLWDYNNEQFVNFVKWEIGMFRGLDLIPTSQSRERRVSSSAPSQTTRNAERK